MVDIFAVTSDKSNGDTNRKTRNHGESSGIDFHIDFCCWFKQNCFLKDQQHAVGIFSL
ncbi:MAG: hypothetical protein WCR52_05135 [Bacteroidota bacterium]